MYPVSSVRKSARLLTVWSWVRSPHRVEEIFFFTSDIFYCESFLPSFCLPWSSPGHWLHLYRQQVQSACVCVCVCVCVWRSSTRQPVSLCWEIPQRELTSTCPPTAAAVQLPLFEASSDTDDKKLSLHILRQHPWWWWEEKKRKEKKREKWWSDCWWPANARVRLSLFYID